MNAQSFLENFGHLASAPGGVEQIRQLVMATALMGRLTPPNSSLADDIDDVLVVSRTQYLSSIDKKEKHHLFGDPLLTEFVIPEGWAWKRIGELCDLQTGATPSRRQPEYFGGEIRWLVSGDINLWDILECDGRISQEGLDNSNCKIIPPDSVLIALNGQGKTRASVALLHVPAACNQSLVAMIPFSREILLPEYLRLALKYRYFEIRDITGQNQRRGLNMGLVSELSLPLPPLEEQRRIVAKVDELMALCDKLEAQQQERERLFPVLSRATHTRFAESPTPENLRAIFDVAGSILPEEFRRSILTLAVSGKLVPFETDHKETVGDHIEFLNGYAFKSEWFRPIGARLCRNVNVSHGVLDWHDSAFVDDTIANEFDRFSLSEGDIVLSLDRPLIATGLKAARVQKHDLPCLLLQRVAKPVPKHDQFDLSYFFLWLNSPKFVDTIKPGRSNGVPHISTREVQRLDFVLPPLSTQLRIVDKVDQLMALVDQLAEQQAKKSKVSTAYAQAAVAAITGTQTKESEPMRAPKTELITKLRILTTPSASDAAPLANLIAKSEDGLSAKVLWQQSGLEIDTFYQQLKTEMTNKWIVEPEPAVMEEVKAS